MSLALQLEQDYIAAYKAKDAVTLGVLRLIKTALKNFQVEHMRAPTEGDIFDVFAKQCKQRLDSMEQYTAVGRPELAAKEEAELAVLRAYMPAPLEGNDLAQAITEAIGSVKATGVKDMGKVMQALLSAHKGRVDGKQASEAVKTALSAL